MNTLMKFLSKEPIENLITTLHYRFDKVIFFGYDDYLKLRQKDTDHFLKKYCGVEMTEFHAVSRTNIDNILKKIREEAETERSRGNGVFLDLTGGKGQVMAAFGMVEAELKLPMHLYWIVEDRLIEYCHDKDRRMSAVVRPQSVELDLDRYIEMHGGVINYRLHKEIKEIDDDETEELVDGIWTLFEKYEAQWTHFAGYFQKVAKSGTLLVIQDAYELREYCNKSRALSTDLIMSFLNDGVALGVFGEAGLTRKELHFTFSSRTAQNILLDAGSILELHTYQILRALTPNCKVGVHLDWDGVIHSRSGKDVVNEIDVLALHGMIPTFVSCKIGTADKNALYELSAVAGRFGGKHTRMMLVTGKPISETDLLRAQEMKIRVMDRNLEPMSENDAGEDLL